MIDLPPAAVAMATGCPARAVAPDTPGDAMVAPAPSAAAQALNNEGKQLYRQRRWDEALARYRAAAQADPTFLPPLLNAACALARSERFAEATTEAAILVRRGYGPWAREDLEATDLPPLHVRPDMGSLRAAMAASAAAWGASLQEGLFFVARTRPPVQLGGQGVLVLALAQEVFAWLPRTGGYRQVTAEDGRVLAFAHSDDGRTLVYIRAGKLVRAPGQPAALRGLAVRALDVPTMTLGPPLPLDGDVADLELRLPAGALPELRIITAADRTPRLVFLQGGALVPTPASSGRPGPAVRLTGEGVAATGRTVSLPGCRLTARDQQPGGGLPRRVQVAGRGRAVTLEARYGAGLAGLAFP
jgi:hypothetical protein